MTNTKPGEGNEIRRGRGTQRGKRGVDRGGGVGRGRGDISRKEDEHADYGEDNKLWQQKSSTLYSEADLQGTD